MRNTANRLLPTDFPPIRRAGLHTLQVNLGYVCNQQCQHCHVNAGPHRTEQMSRETLDEVLHFIRRANIRTLDLTGGAPELHPHFRDLVQAAVQQGVQVQDRCNLTVLTLPEQTGLAEFLAAHQVQVIASLPCYLEQNVDQQRGKGVFADSLTGLRQLNQRGYAQPDSTLQLDLVYNPQGAQLPPPQAALEADYRTRLAEYGVQFNRLLTLTNMPIQRFGSVLAAHGEFDNYLTLLKNAYQAANLPAVMCRHLLSVDWQGYVYDCDFNQMLDMPLRDQTQRLHLRDLKPADLHQRPIAVAEHCYGCTAGQGSSCSGALTDST
ncbi:MAG: arsenosugar biosynthesis radical SAM (seleno)protein ArsS [Pseudomonadota bacterium]